MSCLMERDIEKKLVTVVRKAGGRALKFVSPGFAGVPDRIVLMPGGIVCFAEIKAPGKVMRPLQIKRKEMLESLGFRVFCIDSVRGIQNLISQMGGEAK